MTIARTAGRTALAGAMLAAGQQLSVNAPLTELRFFESQSGRRIA